MEAGCEKIWLKGSGIFYKIYIILCPELSGTNCRAELSAPNCPAPNCPDTETTALVSHGTALVSRSKSPSSCTISSQEPLHHTCHPWLRHALLPASIINATGLCCNPHKSEV